MPTPETDHTTNDRPIEPSDVAMLLERLDDADPDWAVEPGWRELRHRIRYALHTADA